MKRSVSEYRKLTAVPYLSLGGAGLLARGYITYALILMVLGFVYLALCGFERSTKADMVSLHWISIISGSVGFGVLLWCGDGWIFITYMVLMMISWVALYFYMVYGKRRCEDGDDAAPE